MNKTTRIILKTVSTFIIALVVLFAILLAGVRLFGLQIYTVVSPSMAPNIPTGSIVYVARADELKVGDVITYKLDDNTLSTHRIIQLVPDPNDPSEVLYRTKGDANNDPDKLLVSQRQLVGKVVLAIPLLGFVADYIQHPPGSFVAIAVSIALIIAVVVIDMVTNDKSKKKKELKDQTEENKQSS